MDVVAQSSTYYRPIMCQILVKFVEEVSQKPHLEDSDRVGLELEISHDLGALRNLFQRNVYIL